ncbi:DUF6356 family protein [Novosphingobium gossypii]|uniref:DUF6356 family protein n=1 Tax=Novosphingobium gossypii TaxID=1604774 RepID=UPI003D21AE90
MFRKLFVDHPKSVDESYGEHWYVATRFGVLMIGAGLAAIVHGLVPGLLTRTGSEIVKKLYGEMRNRTPRRRSEVTATSPWQLEYEI